MSFFKRFCFTVGYVLILTSFFLLCGGLGDSGVNPWLVVGAVMFLAGVAALLICRRHSSLP